MITDRRNMAIMILMILILTCTVLGVTVNGCPSSCSCRDTTVNCYDNGLTTVPSNVPNSTTILKLYLNNIARIATNSFEGLAALTELNLSYNKIAIIDVRLLRGLSALQTLHLYHNQIVTLSVNVFNGLVDLKNLYLHYNKIATLDVNVFNGLAALETLYLYGNPFDCSMCIMKSFQDFLQRNINFGLYDVRCDGETYKLIYHNFTSCKESQTATESLRSSVTTEYQARTTESTTGIKNTEVIFISCGASILFLLSAGIICFCARKKCKRGNINPNVINHGDNVDRRADISPNVSTNGGSDAQYAEIEEIEMADVIVSTLEQRNLIGGDISIGSSADGIQADEDSRRTNTNVYQSLQENRLNESRQYSSLTSVQIEQRNLTDGDMSSDLSADEIQGDEESRRSNTNVYQSLQRSSLNESRQYSSLTSVHIGQRNLTDGDISSDSSADEIQGDEESRRTNTNVYQSLQESSLNESRQYSSLTSVHIEQRNLTDGDISSDSSADGIQVDEESRRTNTNVYQSLQRSSLNESRLYSSLKSVNLEEILDEPI